MKNTVLVEVLKDEDSISVGGVYDLSNPQIFSILKERFTEILLNLEFEEEIVLKFDLLSTTEDLIDYYNEVSESYGPQFFLSTLS